MISNIRQVILQNMNLGKKLDKNQVKRILLCKFAT